MAGAPATHVIDPAEHREIRRLQQRLPSLFEEGSDTADRTVVVVPSLTLDRDELRKIPGVIHFEERLLFLTQMLRDTRTCMVYVTSLPLDAALVDYALHLVSSLPPGHARRRLTLLDCADGSPSPLTEKILDRPDLVERILRVVPDVEKAYLITYNSSPTEQALALKLGIPLYACDPSLSPLGTKSGGRKLLCDVGVPVPMGFEDIRDEHDLVKSLAELRAADPEISRAVIKLDQSFAGGGNAVFSYTGAPRVDLGSWVAAVLPERLRFAAPAETWESYVGKIRDMGGVVERFVDTPEARSPSVQLEIDPAGGARVLSTHEQMLAGTSRQSFAGCVFPADRRYRTALQDLALRAGEALAARGVLGQLSIDFMVEDPASGEGIQALEINLRMGGATAPFFLLHGLVEGNYSHDTGDYLTPDGEPRCYVASDRAQRDGYDLLEPHDVIGIALRHGLHYSHATRTGVAFFVLGALRGAGKLGMVAIEATPGGAQRLYDTMLGALDRACTSGRR